MKIQLVFTLLSISVFGFGQQINDSMGSFHSINGSIYWEKSFRTAYTFPQLVNAVKRAGVLNNIDTFDNTIVGQSIDAYFDYKGAGYTTLNTPVIISKSTSRSTVLITYRPDSSYTVKVSKILFINQIDTRGTGIGSAQGEVTMLEDYSLKKNGQFKTGILNPKDILKIIHYTIDKTYRP